VIESNLQQTIDQKAAHLPEFLWLERRRANKRGDAKSRGDEYEDENEGGVGGIHRLGANFQVFLISSTFHH